MRSNHISSSDRLRSIREDMSRQFRQLPESAPCVLILLDMHTATLQYPIEPASLPKKPTTSPVRAVVPHELVRRILWWTQCVFFAGAVAMLAYSGFSLMDV